MARAMIAGAMHRFATLTAAALLATGAAGCARSLPRAPLTAPPPAQGDARAEDAIAYARAQLGKRYCWGGRGPSCFDCSGLVQAAWRHAGARLPRTSRDIAASLPEVPPEQLRPGDILWWPGHVGLYVGGGSVIDASDARARVVERPVRADFRVYRPAG